jgi:hypothetical protein
MIDFPPATQRYFCQLGQFIAYWALVEFRLDVTVTWCLAKWDGKPPEPKLPGAFSRKVEVLREYINTHTLRCPPRGRKLIRESREMWNKVVTDLYEVGEARHWAAHGLGLLTIIARHENETIEFQRITRRGSKRIDKRKFSLTQLGVLTNRCWGLSKSLMLFDHIMFETIPQDAFDKLFPELAGKSSTGFPITKRQRHRVR